LIRSENKPEDVNFNHYVTVWLHFNQLKTLYKTTGYISSLLIDQKIGRKPSSI